MNVLSFAEEFSRIILRYMKDTSINDNQSKDASKPLTHEEIISTISNVLSVHGIKSADIKKILDNSLADSSVNTTVVSTVATSVTPIRSEQDDYVCRSSTSGKSTFRTNLDFSTSRLSLGANEKETNSPLKNLRSEYRAQSNPTIRINDMGRSDTFVREKNQTVTIDNEDNVFEDVLTVKMTDLLKELLYEIRNSLMEIVIKVGKLEEQGYLHSVEQKQQSRKNSGSPDVSHLTVGRKSVLRNTTVSKTNLPVAMKISPAKSGTPTSRALGKENVSTRRKSISNMSIVKPAKSVNIARSMSNLSLLSGDEVPPSSTSKLVKNPRYAHVQSTIPKPSRTSNRKT